MPPGDRGLVVSNWEDVTQSSPMVCYSFVINQHLTVIDKMRTITALVNGHAC